MDHERRDPIYGATIPIWVKDGPTPIRVRSTQGRADLLLGMDIVSKLDVAVNYKMRKFKIRQIEWLVMICNNKHQWVLPLTPNARGFEKLDEYFREMSTRSMGL